MLVNNAGIAVIFVDAWLLKLTRWDEVVNTNLKSAFNAMTEAALEPANNVPVLLSI